jgi:leucyl-tRNA synthetase
MAYDHQNIEQKWQKYWEENKTFRTQTPPHPLAPSPSEKGDGTNSLSFRRGLGWGKKKYILDMFPYPSGAGLHVGHPKGYTATDIVSRYYHATGHNVLHTMGFDAFGLPAENYAIKTGTHPAITTAENITVFTEQLKWLGFSYDWDRVVDTTDPEYYRWTQWIFIELFKRWLAYEQDLPINYCPSCKTGLANEEVTTLNTCDRCGTRVERRPIRQWVLRITDYADRLLSDLDGLDWPDGIKEMQRNWIGRSEGCEFKMMKKVEDKPVALLLHGWDNVENRTDWHWMSSIKTELEIAGYEVVMEQLPGNNAPNLEEQIAFLGQYRDRLNEQSIIIGHSMGGFLGMHFVERLDKKIGKLICVAPVFNRLIDHVDWSKEATGWDIGSISMQQDYNPELIKKNVNSWHVFLSENDDGIIYPEAKKHFDSIWGVEITSISNAGHFCEWDGYATFPALLEVLDHISVYTTRVDTVYGMTYAVLAPDHPQVQDFITSEKRIECEQYIERAKGQSDLDRTNEGKEKTGVFTGSYVVNPFNSESVPLWIADYVLGSYGTGAVMAVPAHDERDFEFAKKYDLPIKQSIEPWVWPVVFGRAWYHEELKEEAWTSFEALKSQVRNWEYVFTNDGILVDSSEHDGLTSAEARQIFSQKAETEGFGQKKVNYKLRDWLFSRQRYWGEPIPLIHIANEDYQKLPQIERVENTKKREPGYSDESEVVTHNGDTAMGSLSDTSIFQNIQEVKRKDTIIDFSAMDVTVWARYGVIRFIGKDIEKHFSSKSGREIALRKRIRFSVIHALPFLVYESREVWYFSFKDQIVKVVLKEISPDNFIIKTFYVVKKLISSFEKFLKQAFIAHRNNREYLYIGNREFSEVYTGITGKLIIDSRLPVTLPEVERYEPAGDGQSPLATVPDWVNVELASNLRWKRETNTMPQWGGSCWYYLRYMDSKNPDALAGREALDYWQNVDEYVGGAEHAVLHLLYARFWHKVLYDIGVVPTIEPFHKLTNVGMILAYAYERADGSLVAVDMVATSPQPSPKGEGVGTTEQKMIYREKSTWLEVKQVVAKMSKSLKNVVNPNDIVAEYGADTLRLYEMSMSGFTDTAPWNPDAIIGVRRFLDKAYSTIIEGKNKAKDDMRAMKLLHKTVKKVGEDIVAYKFNTAISALQILLNEGIPTDPEFASEWSERFAIMLHPFAPHMAEELYYNLLCKGGARRAEDLVSEKSEQNPQSSAMLQTAPLQKELTESIYNAEWPSYDEWMLVDDEVTIAIQINGKLRGTYTGLNGVMQDEVSAYAHETADIAKWLDDKILVKEIFIPNKLLSIVVKDAE